MKRNVGEKIEALRLPTISNSIFNMEELEGKQFMLSFDQVKQFSMKY